MECNLVEHDRLGGGSVMFRGGICYDRRTELYRVDRGSLTTLRYKDEILDSIVRPFLGAMGDNARLVQDNARPYTAYVVQEYLEQEAIETIDWPVRSLGPKLYRTHMAGFGYTKCSGTGNCSCPSIDQCAPTTDSDFGPEHAELLH